MGPYSHCHELGGAGFSRIVLDAKGRRALIQYGGQCFLSAQELGANPRKLLDLLSNSGVLTKAEIVEKIWGYKYDLLRHDAILHSTIRLLRLQLGNAHFLETTQEGYRLNINVFDLNDLQNQIDVPDVIQSSNKVSRASFPIPKNFNKLNARQIRLLRILDPGAMIDVRTYCKQFDVCTRPLL